MADTRRIDLLPTAELPAADDYLLLDGEAKGIRKMLAGTFRDASNLTVDLGVPGSVARSLADLLKDRPLSVKDFGAVGDGVADDTAAIQAAIDFMKAPPRRRGILYFPAGLYRTTGMLTIDSTGIHIFGEFRKGTRAFDPPEWSGSHIWGDFERDENNHAILYADGTGGASELIYDVYVSHIRLGIKGTKTQRPDGLSFRNVSEFAVETVEINGNCRDGLALQNCSIGRISDFKSAANQNGIHIINTHFTHLTTALEFSRLNIWLTEKDAVRISGVTQNVEFNNTWMEWYSNGFHFAQANDRIEGTANLKISSTQGTVSSGAPNASSAFIRMTAANNDKQFRITNLQLDNVSVRDKNTSHNIIVTKGGNTSAGTYLERFSAQNSRFIGATDAVLTSDTGATTAFFFGSIVAQNASGPNIALVGGSARQTSIRNIFDALDMRDSLPLFLPTGGPISDAEGQITFSTARNRIRYTDGTDLVTLPRPQVTTYGDANGTISLSASGETHIWNAPLTADRTCTLPSDNLVNGLRYRVVRTAAATGDFDLNVDSGPLAVLNAAGQWCDVEHSGSAWFVVARGSLS